ncbi:MAG: cupin domain-containing protein [Actinobacteria bacterium]|nr:cupin domain-containing protein [Actinomycetota bacterium]
MAIVPPAPMQPFLDDPDDYRPRSRWRLLTDPGDESGRVEGLTMIVEDIAPGDRIPLHRHQVDEVIAIVSGTGEVYLGGATVRVSAESAIFVPAGAAHGTTNTGSGPLRLHAIFPAPVIEMQMLERNPAPGTEHLAPSHTEYDARTGEFRVIG